MLSHRDWDTLEALKKTPKGQLRYHKYDEEEEKDENYKSQQAVPVSGFVRFLSQQVTIKAVVDRFEQFSKAVVEKHTEQLKRNEEMWELKQRQEQQQLQEEKEQSSKEALRQQEKLKEEQRHRTKLLNLRLREAELQRQKELENARQEEGRDRMRRLCDLQHEALQLIQRIETDQQLQNTLKVDLSSFSQRGNTICGNLSNVVRKCTENQFPSQDDVFVAERLVHEMRTLVTDMEKEVTAARMRLLAIEEAAKQQQREAEEQQRQQALAQAQAQANAAAQEKAQKELQKTAQKSIMEPYEELQKKLEHCLVAIQPLMEPGQDKQIKKTKADLVRAVLTPINQISPNSGVKVKEVFHTINDFLMGAPVRRANCSISISQHPQALEFVYYKLAERFADQAEEEVASHHEAAFSLALVVSGIWEKHPVVGELFLGHLYKKCPYAFPYYPIHKKGVPLAEYQRHLGYRVEDSVVENQDHFLKRMSGMIRLYAAVLQMRWPEKHHPHGLNHGWRWMACLLNMEPLPDITATVLYDFLEVCGNALMNVYKGQFWKLIILIKEDFLARVRKVTEAGQMGSVTRLQQFLEEVLRRRDIPLPKGYPGPSFWRT
ncbi:mRNA export factor GLE1 [Gastrophryne carolinensis]